MTFIVEPSYLFFDLVIHFSIICEMSSIGCYFDRLKLINKYELDVETLSHSHPYD